MADTQEPLAEQEHPSIWRRLSRTIRERPVTSLTVAGLIGAVSGAELLSAGLFGGAAVLAWQRYDLAGRARRTLDRARSELHHLAGREPQPPAH